MLRAFLPVALAFALCPLVAALAPTDPAGPLARAQALVGFERSLGLYFEPAVAAWFAARPALLGVVEFLYVWGHVPATVGALVWARLEHPGAFTRARDTFVATQAVVVVGYLLMPTAPPRLLTGEVPDGGIVALLQSPYAALPSGHVAFAIVTAGIVGTLAAWRWVRWAAPLYPLLVTLVVVGTANHFWIDAVAGALAAASGFVIARTRTRQLAIPRAAVARTDGHVGPDPPARRARPASSP